MRGIVFGLIAGFKTCCEERTRIQVQEAPLRLATGLFGHMDVGKLKCESCHGSATTASLICLLGPAQLVTVPPCGWHVFCSIIFINFVGAADELSRC